jgi:hypothetical protein
MDGDAPASTNRPPACSRVTSPRDIVLWSRSTTYMLVFFTSNVAALERMMSCTIGIMTICSTMSRSRKIWRNSFRSRKRSVRSHRLMRRASA